MSELTWKKIDPHDEWGLHFGDEVIAIIGASYRKGLFSLVLTPFTGERIFASEEAAREAAMKACFGNLDD